MAVKMKIGSPYSVVSTYISSSLKRKADQKLSSRLRLLYSQHSDREHMKLTVLQIFSKRQYILLATSKDQQSNNELKPIDFKLEKQYPTTEDEDTSSTDISYHHIDGTGRKPGFISFITKNRIEYEILFFKFIGPTVIVASFVFSSLYLIRILSAILKYYLIADLVLDLTKAFFYCGVSGFLFVTNLWRSMEPACAETNRDSAFPLGNTISSIAILVLCLIIPILVTRGSLWPWITRTASTPLNPYLLCIVSIHAFELYKKIIVSPSWPAICKIFRDWVLRILQFIFL